MTTARDPAGNKPKICHMCDKVHVPAGTMKSASNPLYCSCIDYTKLSEVMICIDTEEFIYWEMSDRQTDLSDDVEE